MALGLSNVGKCNDDVASAIVQTLMERSDEQLDKHAAKYFGLGFGLLYMGQQNKCEASLEAVNCISHEPTKKYLSIIVESLAYIGSGNVLKVQDMVHECMSDEKDSEVAILGLALIASSE